MSACDFSNASGSVDFKKNSGIRKMDRKIKHKVTQISFPEKKKISLKSKLKLINDEKGRYR